MGPWFQCRHIDTSGRTLRNKGQPHFERNEKRGCVRVCLSALPLSLAFLQTEDNQEVQASIASERGKRNMPKILIVISFNTRMGLSFAIAVQTEQLIMPKFTCTCGCVLNLSLGPQDYELTLIPDKNIEEIGDLLAKKQVLDDEVFFNMIDEGRNTVYRCPACRRIHVESRTQKNHFETYVLEAQ